MARPNILWIVTTQWRAQASGHAGDPNACTPFLDALAAESVNYAQAVTPHPFGPMARAALLTGLHSPENGVRDYFDPLPRSTRTIGHQLGASGYLTAFFGKWGVGRQDPTQALVGEAQAKLSVPADARGGFEFWEGFEGGFLLNDPWLHGTRLPEPARFDGYQSEVICARAGEWMLRQTAGRPWFAVVSLEAAHPPYHAPAAGVQARPAASIVLAANVPRAGEAEKRARQELAGYYAHIEATDHAIGRWLLSQTNRDQTVVVFTSVHGDMHGAHGLFRKGWPYEESVRVPLLVRGASGSRRSGGAGKQDASAISLADLPAMTLAWSRGQDALPSANAVQRISMPSVVALPDQCDRVWRGVRTKTHKLILNADRSPWLFFDLEHDPLERHNLADEPEWSAKLDELARQIP